MKTSDVERLIQKHIFEEPEHRYDPTERKFLPTGGTRKSSGWHSWADLACHPPEEITEVEGVGLVNVLKDSYTGYEEGEAHTYMVLEVNFPDGTTKHYEKSGFYQSFDGTNWDGGFYRVDPQQVNVTRYLRVNDEEDK